MANWFKPEHEIGYNAKYTPAQNAIMGREKIINGKPQTYLTVYHQLHALANEFKGKSEDRKFTEKERSDFDAIAGSFARSAQFALRMHYEIKE